MGSLLSTYQETAQASIEAAVSLPFAVYHDSQVFDLEVSKVFHQEWVFACAEKQLANPGDYFVLDLAGESVAIIHGKDGRIRALSNLCRHRGTPLLDEGFGNLERNIVCPYHAWTYDDNGQFKGAPFTGDIVVDKQKHCLPEFSCQSWKGLLFVHLGEPQQTLAERLEYLDDYLAVFEPERFDKPYVGSEESWQANWKLAVENAIESYHLFKVHKETLETVTPSKEAFYVCGSSEWSITGGKMKDQRGTLLKWFTGDYPEVYNHYLLVFLPPSFIGILTYEGFDWIQILPQTPTTCAIRSGGMSAYQLTPKETAESQFADAFMAEDKVICERVQRGMQSRLAKGGKLVSMEKILVDFRQFLANRIFNTVPDDFIESPKVDLFLNQEES